MTTFVAPTSFEKFGDNFKDIENKDADFQYLLEKSLKTLSAPEKNELARFLEDCIKGQRSDAELRTIWLRTGPFLAFSPMRVFFRQVLDELQRPGK